MQAAAEPSKVSAVQVLPSEHELGQLEGGSQVSDPVSTRLPQPAHSPSLMPEHPLGQQPSPLRQAVTGLCEQTTLQVSGAPAMVSLVQELPSEQEAGQLLGGSQVSGPSSLPLPQPVQSASVAARQPLGQHPSPPKHCVTGVNRQAAVQVVAEPISTSVVHTSASEHELGQLLGGPQVSAASSA